MNYFVVMEKNTGKNMVKTKIGMKVISTNVSKPTSIIWLGQEEITGIYKYPTIDDLCLKSESVVSDHVEDLINHGGLDKACYLFSADHYPYWKKLYPNLDWNWGMFGENITISNLDEESILIGDVLKIGSAIVQVCQPRQPCYKLGIRFGSQRILKQYVRYGFPGIYVRILQEGSLKMGDSVELIERFENSISVCDSFKLIIYQDTPEFKSLLTRALADPNLAESYKEQLAR